MRSGTPGGGGGRGGRGGSGEPWQYVKAANGTDLLNLATERAKQLTPQGQAQQQAAVPGPVEFRGRGGSGARYTVGVRDAGIFDGNVPMMATTAALLNFGRIDVVSNDGAWFNFNSGVSDKGREAIKAMEANNVTVNLVDHSTKLLKDVLEVTTKPFLVTLNGPATIDSSLFSSMNKKNTLLLLDCNPAEVTKCVDRLQAFRKLFGDTDNLVLSMRSGDKTEEAKKALYMALVKNGWTKDEIYAIAGAGSGNQQGGNLSRLMPPRPGGGPAID
jgi:hypothetical protein